MISKEMDPPGSRVICVDNTDLEQELGYYPQMYIVHWYDPAGHVFVRPTLTNGTLGEILGGFFARRFKPAPIHRVKSIPRGRLMCECGAHAVKSNLHSTWCQLYEQLC